MLSLVLGAKLGYVGFIHEVGEQMDFSSCELNCIKLELEVIRLNDMVIKRSFRSRKNKEVMNNITKKINDQHQLSFEE